MKKFFFVSLAFAFVIGISCNNSENKKSGNTDAAKNKVDSVWKQLDEAHVMGMSKMSKLSRFQTEVEHLIDSIGKLPSKAKADAIGFKTNLEALLKGLKSAQDGMDTWMNEFRYDSAENNPEVRVKYFESEKIKVAKVASDMQNVIQKADSLLKKPAIH